MDDELQTDGVVNLAQLTTKYDLPLEVGKYHMPLTDHGRCCEPVWMTFYMPIILTTHRVSTEAQNYLTLISIYSLLNSFYVLRSCLALDRPSTVKSTLSIRTCFTLARSCPVIGRASRAPREASLDPRQSRLSCRQSDANRGFSSRSWTNLFSRRKYLVSE